MTTNLVGLLLLWISYQCTWLIIATLTSQTPLACDCESTPMNKSCPLLVLFSMLVSTKTLLTVSVLLSRTAFMSINSKCSMGVSHALVHSLYIFVVGFTGVVAKLRCAFVTTAVQIHFLCACSESVLTPIMYWSCLFVFRGICKLTNGRS